MSAFTNLSMTAATHADIPALINLAVNAFGESVHAQATTEFPTGLQTGVRSPLAILVAKEGDTPIGMVGLLEDYTYPDTYCLSWLAVAPAYQRQGLGTALVHAAIQGASILISGSHGTVILATTQSNRAFYTRCGFTGDTRLHTHPQHAEPHILLSHPVSKPL